MSKYKWIVHPYSYGDKGMVIREFCDYWGMSKRTYERMCADKAKHDKLKKMIEGVKR